MSCDYSEVSVKKNYGVEELFEKVIDKCLMLQKHIEEMEKSAPKKAKNADFEDGSFKLKRLSI